MTMPERIELPTYETLLTEAIKSLAVDSGVVSFSVPAGSNHFQDNTKNWATDVHKNRLVKIIKGRGVGQLAVILGNTNNGLAIRRSLPKGLDTTSVYVILEKDLAQILRDVLGGGADISGANPMPVSGVIAATNLTVDPFTGTGNIAPATVRSSATNAFRACKVTIHWSAATSNPVTIALDAHQGPAYDTVLRVMTMGAGTDLVYFFPENAKFETGDAITVDWTDDTLGVATWGVEITWEE